MLTCVTDAAVLADVPTALLCHYSTLLRLYSLDYHLGSPLLLKGESKEPIFCI